MKEDSFAFLLKNSGLSSDVQERLLRAIERMNFQEQILLLQLFVRYPDKISSFWEISKRKFDFLKDGEGKLEDILSEELDVFT